MLKQVTMGSAALKVGELKQARHRETQTSYDYYSRRVDMETFTTSRSEPLRLVSDFGLDPGLCLPLPVAGGNIRALHSAL